MNKKLKHLQRAKNFKWIKINPHAKVLTKKAYLYRLKLKFKAKRLVINI